MVGSIATALALASCNKTSDRDEAASGPAIAVAPEGSTPDPAPAQQVPDSPELQRYPLAGCGASIRLPMKPETAHRDLPVVYLANWQGKRFGVTCSAAPSGKRSAASLEAAHKGSVDGIPGEVVRTARGTDWLYTVKRTESGLILIRTHALSSRSITLMFGFIGAEDEFPAREFLESLRAI